MNVHLGAFQFIWIYLRVGFGGNDVGGIREITFQDQSGLGQVMNR